MIKKKRTFRSRFIFKENEWFCLDCPIWVWSESYFDEFTQFEHLIKREGDDRKE